MNEKRTLKVGLALGSGGARGLAHIGVLKALKANNIPIDFIAGSSIGALIGGFYACGISVEEIEKIALEANWKQMLSLVDISFDGGLVEGEKVKKFIEGYIKDTEFKDCKIPFSAVATNLENGDAVILDSGEMCSAIRASISVPLFFKPVKVGNKTLADGGLSDPVPVDIVKSMGADIVIAVNINDNYSNTAKDNNYSLSMIAENSIKIMNKHLALFNTRNADIVITPMVNDTKWNEFTNGQNIILEGERATRESILQIIKILYGK